MRLYALENIFILRECVQSILRPQIDLQPTGFVLEVDSYGAFLKKSWKIGSRLIFEGHRWGGVWKIANTSP